MVFLLFNVPHQASLSPSCPHPHDTSHCFVPLLPNKDKYVHIIRYCIGMTNILLCFHVFLSYVLKKSTWSARNIDNDHIYNVFNFLSNTYKFALISELQVIYKCSTFMQLVWMKKVHNGGY